MTNLSYHNSPELKARFIGHVEKHREQDAIVRGHYGRIIGGQWKGCAVGCSLRSLDEIEGRPLMVENGSHSDLAKRLGIPLVLARLEDRIFEGLPPKEATLWPTLFARAIPVGADLTMVWPRLAHWMLGDETAGVIRFAKTERTKKVIGDVVELFGRQIGGETIAQSDWQKVRSAAAAADAYAYAAAAAAADAYAYAAAAAADAAAAAAAADADAYAYAAADAAYAAAAAAAADARIRLRESARQKHYVLMGEKLLSLMMQGG